MHRGWPGSCVHFAADGLPTVGTVADGPRRVQWARAVGTIAVSYVVNVAVKQVARRPRPQVQGLPQLVGTPTQLSFPSSHSTSSFAAANAFSPLIADMTGSKTVGRTVYPVAGAMALSRIYLGVHYPSDIAVGSTIGTLIARRLRWTPTR